MYTSSTAWAWWNMALIRGIFVFWYAAVTFPRLLSWSRHHKRCCRERHCGKRLYKHSRFKIFLIFKQKIHSFNHSSPFSQFLAQPFQCFALGRFHLLLLQDWRRNENGCISGLYFLWVSFFQLTTVILNSGWCHHRDFLHFLGHVSYFSLSAVTDVTSALFVASYMPASLHRKHNTAKRLYA